MEYIDYAYLIATGLAGYFIGFKVSKRQNTEVTNILKNELITSNASDRSAYLGVLRRELGNEIMNRDPDRYLKNYYHLLDEKAKFEKLANEEIITRIQTISQDFRYFTDFDVIGTRDYVLYSNAFDTEDIDSLIRTYNNIVSYALLQTKIDEFWKYKVSEISEEELEHLKEYVSKVRDTKFLAHLHQAERDYWNYKVTEPEDLSFENNEYTVHPITDVAEVAYGVYIKKTDEYGIFSTFYGDNKNFDSYYRTDATFEKRIPLYNLHIPYCIAEH